MSPKEQRDALIVAHIPLVKRIARKLRRELRLPCFELDDLVQAGMVGLIQAADRFDPQKYPDVPFGAYARRRIKGEMQESVGMHKPDGKLCRIRRWNELTSPPIPECEVRDLEDCEGSERTHATPDPRASACTSIEIRQRRELVNGALQAIPEREAKVIELHYGREMKISEIAHSEAFTVGEERISQIHKAGLRSIRNYFDLRGLKKAA